MKLKFKNTTAGQMAAEALAEFAGADATLDELSAMSKTTLLHELSEHAEKEVLVSAIIAMLPRELRIDAAIAWENAGG